MMYDPYSLEMITINILAYFLLIFFSLYPYEYNYKPELYYILHLFMFMELYITYVYGIVLF